MVKAEIEISFKLEHENTRGCQDGVRATSWCFHGVGIAFQLELIEPRGWFLLPMIIGKSLEGSGGVICWKEAHWKKMGV